MRGEAFRDGWNPGLRGELSRLQQSRGARPCALRRCRGRRARGLRRDPEGERLHHDRRAGRSRRSRLSRRGRSRADRDGRPAASRLRRDDCRARLAAGRGDAGPREGQRRGRKRPRRDPPRRHRGEGRLPGRSPATGRAGPPADSLARQQSRWYFGAVGPEQSGLEPPLRRLRARGAQAGTHRLPRFRRFRGASKRTRRPAPFFARRAARSRSSTSSAPATATASSSPSPPIFNGSPSPRSTSRWRGTGRSGFRSRSGAATGGAGADRFTSIPKGSALSRSAVEPSADRPGDRFRRFRQPTVTSILLVIDLANATPGRSGMLRVLSSALVN